jgi:hypothetical protein
VSALPSVTGLTFVGSVLHITLDAPVPAGQPLWLRQRSSRRVWPLPATGSPATGSPATVVVDVASALDGEPLGTGPWDPLIGPGEAPDEDAGRGAVALPARDVAPAVLMRHGELVVGYANKAGRLSLDVGGTLRSVLGSGRPGLPDVEVDGVPYDGGLRLRVGLPRVSVIGPAQVEGFIWLSKALRFPARLTTDANKAEVQADGVVLPPGDYRIGGQLGDRGGWSRLHLLVGNEGDVQLTTDQVSG